MKRDATIALLQNVWLFERCSRAELSLVGRTVTLVHVEPLRCLAREGSIGREFFVVVSGSVEVTRAGEHVATLGPGDFFGEMALLDRQPRAATVVAAESCDLLVLTHHEFLSIVSKMPSVDRKIIAVLAERLRTFEDRFLPEEPYGGERRQIVLTDDGHAVADERSRLGLVEG